MTQYVAFTIQRKFCGLLYRINARSNLQYRILFVLLLLLALVGLLINNYQKYTNARKCFVYLPMLAAQTRSSLPNGNESADFDAVAAGGSNPNDVAAGTAAASDASQMLADVLLSGQKPEMGKSIFFHETSCHLKPLSQLGVSQLSLSARQACAIESAALHNPNFGVFVLFASPVYSNNETNSDIVKALMSYTNVHFRNLNLWTYAAGTPIYQWIKDGQLFKSRYVFSHTSDFLRYLTLFRWGGIYLDMDVVILKSLEQLPPNYTGAESNHSLAAGVMNFAPSGFGHAIAEDCLLEFQRNFKGHDWGNNGPGVITRVMQRVCGTKKISQMSTKRCVGFKVFESSAFYAIPWKKWTFFFESQHLNETLLATKDSYAIHVWNNLSKHQILTADTKTAYTHFAAKNCPKVYQLASGHF